MAGNFARRGNFGNIFFSDVASTMASYLGITGELEGENIFKGKGMDEKNLEKIR